MKRYFFIALACLISMRVFGQEQQIVNHTNFWSLATSKIIISTVFKSKIQADINKDEIADEISVTYNKRTEILSLEIIINDSLNKPFEEIN